MNNSKAVKGNHTKKMIMGAVLATVIVSIVSVFLCNKTFPTAEGWYSYYAKCILDGDIVYKDFEYLFTPVYMYIIAFYIKCFGYNVFALRLLGVIIFAVLTLVIYLILTRVFSINASVIGAVTGMLYLQSEVYSVFYDYVRVMDIFASMAILFMILCLKRWQEDSGKRNIYLYLWGVCSALFMLVKQNMGGLFFVYSFMLLCFCGICFSWKVRRLLTVVLQFFLAFAVPIAGLVILTAKMGIVNDMIYSVFFGGIEAKGGITAILFQWIISGYPSFGKVFLWGVIFLLLLIMNKHLSITYPGGKLSDGSTIWYGILAIAGLLVLCSDQSVGNYFSMQGRLDVATVFMSTVILLLILLVKLFWNVIRKKQISPHFVLVVSLLGAYFTLCYGSGMSGGLSIGESGLGLGILICVIYDSFRFRYSVIFRMIVAAYCLYLSFACVGYKFVYPCLWWGIDEVSVYDACESTDIPMMEGIKVSKDTKEMYESVVDIIDSNTDKDEFIYCFPHIPLFYVLCDRKDPGVYSKVQWFDVSSKKNLEKDIDILYEEKPSVIIIYNLFESTYEGHETLFNHGESSGTRVVRDELYTLVNTYDYSYEGTYISENNNISVYTLRKNGVNDSCVFEVGNGTVVDPYVIDSKEKLVNLAMMVNQGNCFENVYFVQQGDFDLTDVIWVPAGYIEDMSFKGSYENMGYTIQNINSSIINCNLPFGNEIFIWR